MLESLGVITFMHEDGAGHQPEDRVAPSSRIGQELTKLRDHRFLAQRSQNARSLVRMRGSRLTLLRRVLQTSS